LRAAEAQDAEDAKPLPSRITDVTVYADRAQVTRTATVNPGAEPSRLVFAKLPAGLTKVRRIAWTR